MQDQIEILQNIGFRNARLTDLSDIMHIEHASFAPAICESETVYEERIRIFPEGFRIMTYTRDVIGFLSTELWTYQEERCEEEFRLGHSIGKSHSSSGTELYISSMGLAPRYRGAGLGRRLFCETIKYMITQFPQIQSAVLIVSSAWTSALQIYKKEGFREIARLERFFYYPTEMPFAEDGIVMRKKFSNL